MISFQLAGATALLFKFFKQLKKDNVIKACLVKSEYISIIDPDDDGNYWIDKFYLRKKFSEALAATLSIAYILIGYILLLFQPISTLDVITNAIYVFGIFLFLIFIIKLVTSLLPPTIYKENLLFDNEADYAKYVDLTACNSDIEQIFKKDDFKSL